MTRVKLIDYIRVLEHNYNVAVDFNERQARNIEQMIKDGGLIYNFEFMKKYGVDISGGMPDDATAMEEICRRTYNKGWMDCKATMDGHDTNVGWILCSERLPVPNEFDETGHFFKAYLVQDKRKTMYTALWDGKWWTIWTRGIVINNVVAWMPLPEPHKEGDKEWVK